MAFRAQDFKCKDCEKISEVLLDSKLPDEEQAKCEHCGSTNVERVISIGTGKGGHISWSKWRV